MAAASESYDIIVIGAGHNGLTAATLLALAGMRTLILEQRHEPGGLAVGEVFHDAQRSAGLLTDTHAVDPAVIKTLKLETHGLQQGAAPPVFIPQPASEGHGLLLHEDRERMQEEIAAFSSRDADRRHEFADFVDSLRPALAAILRDEPPAFPLTGLRDLMSVAGKGLKLRRLGAHAIRELLRVAPMCVADFLDEWFESDLLKAALAAPCLYGEAFGPRSPQTTALLLRHFALSTPSAIGSAPELIHALMRAATSAGVTIRTGSPVATVDIENGRVQGVRLTNGESISAGRIAASCDPKRAMLDLVSPRYLSLSARDHLEKYRMRSATAQVNLALRSPLTFACRPELKVVRSRIVGSSMVDMERASDAAKYRQFSARPMLELCAMPVHRSDDNPSASHIVSIAVQCVPYDLDGGWSDTARTSLYESVLDVLREHAPTVEDNIIAHEMLTPVDIENRFGVTQGHIHHGEHGLDQLIVRPTLQCAHYQTPISGLYLCGSGVHPGGGLTCTPGRLAAQHILRRRGR